MNYYTFDEGKKELLLSTNNGQVMMEWEKPYMEACIDKLEPKIDYLVEIYEVANWNEREAYEMFGISFTNHPNLEQNIYSFSSLG